MSMLTVRLGFSVSEVTAFQFLQLFTYLTSVETELFPPPPLLFFFQTNDYPFASDL